MAKRKKTEPELPLFDLPMRPDGNDVDEAWDDIETVTAAGDVEDDYDEIQGDHDERGFNSDLMDSDLIDPAEEENIDDDLSDEPSLESVSNEPEQRLLPDLVVEPPVREQPRTTTVGRRDLEAASPSTPRARRSAEGGESSLFDEPDAAFDDDEDFEIALAAPLGERALAGLADLGINLLMLAIAALGCHLVGVRLTLDLWPPFLGLSLVLSFLYWIIPLAFWGQTPGMAWLGNIARSFDDEPLSFGQALLRWLGAWITAGLVGLPQLLALGGRSLSDRLSDSKTLVLPDDDFDD